MGKYDTVEGIQIKSTPDPCYQTYNVGDIIDLPDGLHVSYEGVFLVEEGRIKGTARDLYDKWGERLSLDTILDPKNPVLQALEKIEKRREL